MTDSNGRAPLDPAAETSTAREVTLPVAGTELSGLYDGPQEPLALIVALHGGGLTARYFHGNLHPSLSLLTLGRRMGYGVLALDRPGYRASADIPAERTTLTGQAETIWEALSGAEISPAALPILLVGHSFGAMVCLQMAGMVPQGRQLWGVDFSGIGTTLADTVTAADTDFRRLHWGAEYDYPEHTFVRTNMPTSRMPAAEPGEAMLWSQRVTGVASAVSCPVRITLADGELNWSNPPQELAGLFTRATSVEIATQARSGHNISLSWAARAYHLRVLAFFDDCLRAHRLLRD